VLDVGTGGGLLLIGAAKRARRGRCSGVDIWSGDDLSNNTAARAMKNAAIEAVAACVEIRDDDARHLSFADEVFDVVVSMLCLHNIAGADGRLQALHEIVRVLKPGGRALISDLAHAEEYARVLTALGLDVTVSPPLLDTFPFQRLVDGRKPVTQG
jgi:ubiquinone/menaquinone biosynthesis C-methylase UbiE